jgi:hypothetical protein
MFAYPIAAALVLAIAITFWIQNNDIDINDKITDTEDIDLFSSAVSQDDFLISSLMVSDSEMEEFLDDYILDEIIVEADRKEQEIDDLIINSLFVEDSLIDSFMNQNLIENIVL